VQAAWAWMRACDARFRLRVSSRPASDALADYPQVYMLGVGCKPVNFGGEKSWSHQIGETE